jgi:hypothetical protein
MTIEEAKYAKLECEQRIAEILSKFIDETGLTIEDVRFEDVRIHGERALHGFTITVTL